MTTTSIAPRKLPVQRRARVTRDAIIEGAAQLLGTSGLPGFNTNAVAVRAGVSIGTLYQYFPNKDALMAALIDREQQARADILGSIVDDLEGYSLSEGVSRLIDAAVAGEMSQPQLSRSLDHEEARLPVAALVGNAQSLLDEHVARFLGPHLPGIADAQLRQIGRTVRVIARAIIDDMINGDSPDQNEAREQSRLAVLGYLDKHRRQS